MHADHAVDDKFQTRQANAFVRQAGEVKRTVRVTDVHHNFQRQIRHGIHAGALHAEVEDIGIHVARIAFGTGDGYVLSVLHAFGCVTAADNRRNTQFAGNDRRMAGTTAAVGDDGRRFLHDRFPVRVGHVGHQYVAWLNTVHLADVVDHFHRTGTDAVTNRATFRHNFALGVQRITLHHLTARTDGLRTRLDDKQLAGVPVFRPFDIHRTAVVFFNLHRLLRQFLHFGVGQGEAVALLLRHIFNLNLLAMLLGWGIDHADFFRAHGAAHHRRATRGQRRLVYIKFVRVHRALHHHLTQTPCRGDEHHLVEARFGIDGEHHAG